MVSRHPIRRAWLSALYFVVGIPPAALFAHFALATVTSYLAYGWTPDATLLRHSLGLVALVSAIVAFAGVGLATRHGRVVHSCLIGLGVFIAGGFALELFQEASDAPWYILPFIPGLIGILLIYHIWDDAVAAARPIRHHQEHGQTD